MWKRKETKMKLQFKKAMLTALLFGAYILVMVLAVLVSMHPLIPLVAFTLIVASIGKIYRTQKH